jgi:hypothetical protein
MHNRLMCMCLQGLLASLLPASKLIEANIESHTHKDGCGTLMSTLMQGFRDHIVSGGTRTAAHAKGHITIWNSKEREHALCTHKALQFIQKEKMPYRKKTCSLYLELYTSIQRVNTLSK